MYQKKKLLDSNTNKPICTLKGHTNDITSIDFTGRNLIATGSTDKTIRLFKWLPGDSFEELEHSPLEGHTYGVNCVTFSPFGTKLASASTDGSTIIWDVKTGKNLCSLQPSTGESAGIRTCAFSPNSSFLVTGGDDDLASIWDVSTLSLMREIGRHEATVTSVAFTPDSSYIVTGSSNGELRLWDGRYGHSVPLLIKTEVHDLGITTVDFNPVIGREDTIYLNKEYCLATGGQDTDLHLWTISVGLIQDVSKIGESSNVSISLHHTLCGHKDPIMMLKFNLSGTMIVSASGDKTVRLWDAIKLVPLAVLVGHSRYVTSCTFSDDGYLVAAGGGDRCVHVWRVDEAIKSSSQSHSRRIANDLPILFQRENKKLISWTIGDVGCWLGEQGLAEYTHNFRQQAIDGRELLTLTDETLEIKLGIDALGHRSKILRFVRKFETEEASGSGEKIPSDYLCPITQEIMNDPVLCADGFSYEREAVEAWLTSGKNSSPMTNELLPHLLLTPNRTLRNLISRYKEENT